MGLNPRGWGRGGKSRRGGGMSGGPKLMFRPDCPPGMCGMPPMGFPPGPPPFGPPFYGGPCGSNFGPRRPPGYGKFPRKNFKGRNQQRNQNSQEGGLDFTKPWVTDELKAEEAKKQECLETWRKTKDDTDWSKYKEQKQLVETMYNKAKTEYVAAKPDEGLSWYVVTSVREKVYCEACDRSFKDERELYLHETEHELCGRDGCMYFAHPKLVAKHVKMQHDTGLYKRIGRLNTEEEIAKWIEERKRKYPTRKAVDEKKAAEEEKMKRGERIKEDKSKFNKSFPRKRERQKLKTTNKKTARGRKNLSRKRKELEYEMTVEEALKEENSWRGCIPPFGGIPKGDQIVPEVSKEDGTTKEVNEISDEEWETTADNKIVNSISNSLGMLATCYDSAISEEGEENAPEEVKTVRVKEETLPEQAETKKRPPHQGRRKRGRSKRRRTMDDNKENADKIDSPPVQPIKKRELTLLEKLLSKEIRHERNVILQCIRYVIQNEFFNGNDGKTQPEVQNQVTS